MKAKTDFQFSTKKDATLRLHPFTHIYLVFSLIRLLLAS
jgi:hypothetical protein